MSFTEIRKYRIIVTLSYFNYRRYTNSNRNVVRARIPEFCKNFLVPSLPEVLGSRKILESEVVT